MISTLLIAATMATDTTHVWSVLQQNATPQDIDFIEYFVNVQADDITSEMDELGNMKRFFQTENGDSTLLEDRNNVEGFIRYTLILNR